MNALASKGSKPPPGVQVLRARQHCRGLRWPGLGRLLPHPVRPRWPPLDPVAPAAVDLLFLAAGRWSRHPIFGAAAGAVTGAVDALPAYVLALAGVAEREGSPAGLWSRWGPLGLADVAPQRVLLVVGVTIVGAALSGLAGPVVGSLVLAQRQVALRRAPPKCATAGRPSTAT